jgi:hypothetical protein
MSDAGSHQPQLRVGHRRHKHWRISENGVHVRLRCATQTGIRHLNRWQVCWVGHTPLGLGLPLQYEAEARLTPATSTSSTTCDQRCILCVCEADDDKRSEISGKLSNKQFWDVKNAGKEHKKVGGSRSGAEKGGQYERQKRKWSTLITGGKRAGKHSSAIWQLITHAKRHKRKRATQKKRKEAQKKTGNTEKTEWVLGGTWSEEKSEERWEQSAGWKA